MNRNPQEVTNWMKSYVGSRKVTKYTELASFENKYGERKVIHITRSGLHVKRNSTTVAVELGHQIAVLLGRNIKQRRQELGLTLQDTCLRAGLATVAPKARLWEIENNPAKHGLRLGTLFALAAALETTPTRLLPTLEEVLDGAAVVAISETTLKVQP
jgi:hypothetical protein